MKRLVSLLLVLVLIAAVSLVVVNLQMKKITRYSTSRRTRWRR